VLACVTCFSEHPGARALCAREPGLTLLGLCFYVSVNIYLTRRLFTPYVLNRYSRIPGTQPDEYEYRTPTGEPCIRQEHVYFQGPCTQKTSGI